MNKYSPGMADDMTIGEAYLSGVPTLTYMDLCYGDGSADIWLVLWISDTYAKCGFLNNQVTDRMKIGLANSIRKAYYYLNLNELIVFFKNFLAGKYERFYSSPNPQIISSSIGMFCYERSDTISKVERIRDDERKKIDMNSTKAVSFEEWRKSKEERGEVVHIQAIKTSMGVAIKREPKIDTAIMIVENTSRCGYETLGKFRKMFIDKYNEDPYDFYKRMGNKKIREYEKERDS